MFNLCKFELLKKYLSLVSVLLILRFLLTFITGQDRKMERGSIFDVYPSHLKDLFQITSFSLDSEIPLQKASLLVSPSGWTLGTDGIFGVQGYIKRARLSKTLLAPAPIACSESQAPSKLQILIASLCRSSFRSEKWLLLKAKHLPAKYVWLQET